MASPAAVALLEFTGTCFEDVVPEALEQLLRTSRTYEVRSGRSVFQSIDLASRVAMIISGTARSFLTAADGRQLTTRYARRGALVGKYSDLSGDHAPLALQAITDCLVLEFELDTFLGLVATEITVVAAINVELTRRLDDIYATVGDSAFGSLRQRVIRHLLALSVPGADAGFPRAQITQQQLADAVGSSREVVSRQLASLRLEQLIRTEPKAIELLSVEQLVACLNHWQAESPY